ncbi:hypothetical protein IQ268_10160 [Oculatella sp. LEGE 06141]|uniref:hypothetical protein n=1 Tax=Oculatella sp. LEGE 06141 TaxID=1828648 RepID=UPI00187DE9A6|nr:hypothetical protein [Oculatella sp. LEGE 06141]MBE9178924.1 hypothetical protein [Oculatella sp. LEGE 06141]
MALATRSHSPSCPRTKTATNRDRTCSSPLADPNATVPGGDRQSIEPSTVRRQKYQRYNKQHRRLRWRVKRQWHVWLRYIHQPLVLHDAQVELCLKLVYLGCILALLSSWF